MLHQPEVFFELSSSLASYAQGLHRLRDDHKVSNRWAISLASMVSGNMFGHGAGCGICILPCLGKQTSAALARTSADALRPGFNQDGSRMGTAWSGNYITAAIKQEWLISIQLKGFDSALSARGAEVNFYHCRRGDSSSRPLIFDGTSFLAPHGRLEKGLS